MIHLPKMFILVLISCLLLTVNTAFADRSFRCGGDLIERGDRRLKVLQACGEPVSKDVVGYTVRGGVRELKIEEWVYGPKDGHYYYLTFIGGRLAEIESVRK